jgi:hypothetical protein
LVAGPFFLIAVSTVSQGHDIQATVRADVNSLECTGPTALREYRAKKEWLDDQLRRAQEAPLNDEAPDVSDLDDELKCVERLCFHKVIDIHPVTGISFRCSH